MSVHDIILLFMLLLRFIILLLLYPVIRDLGELVRRRLFKIWKVKQKSERLFFSFPTKMWAVGNRCHIFRVF